MRAVCHAVSEDGFAQQCERGIDGSKFKAVNTRDKNFTRGKANGVARSLRTALRVISPARHGDRQEPSEALAAKTAHLKEKLAKLGEEMAKLAAYEKQMLATLDQQGFTDRSDSRSMATSGRGSGVVGYNVQVAVETSIT